MLVMGKRRSLWLTVVLSHILPLLGNMETILEDRGPVEDFNQLVGVLSKLLGCLSLRVEVVVVVVLLLLLLHHSGVGSVASLGILPVSAQIDR